MRRAMQLLESHFSQLEPGLFGPIIYSIRSPEDPWMVPADFRSHADARRRASNIYRDQDGRITKSILNTAASGRFSTDRTMQEHN